MIPPEGIFLPELPPTMGWRNPVRGYDHVRTEWELYVDSAIDAYTVATIQIERTGDQVANLKIASSAGAASERSMPLAQAFEEVAEFARSWSR
ncbi:hypothetical protein M0D44_20090 [Xanthomonas prunicola]|uniref:hypothetical protein n=1 Tax=Xanthomonas prunicola TaxID=2053930 RepID=UPI0021B381A0|nr:hypothetical protein [Xanthomonas prunicola]UXA48546.1 hypothetical protein M0D44_20090 [Xanthomonas prunicola]